MTNITLGINNGFALKRWPEPELWAEIVRHELNLSCVQMSFDLIDPGWPVSCRETLCRRISAAAQEHKILLQSAFTGLGIYAQSLLLHPLDCVRSAAQEWYCAAVDLTASLQATAVGGHMGAMSYADYRDSERRSRLRQELIAFVRRLSRRAADRGLTHLLWEPMPVPREIPHTPEEARALLDEINAEAAVPVRLCVDLGHCCPWDLAEPGDPYKWLEALLPWTAAVHLQQTDGRGDHHWPFTPEFNAQGLIEPKRVLDIVRHSSLEELYLFFEICHPFEVSDERVVEDLKRSVELWQEHL